MTQQFERRLHWLGDLDRRLLSGRLGLEKESLRVGPDGMIAQTPHPAVLGSALTHPSITTDYSEAQLELVTEPYADSGDALAALDRIHRFIYSQLDDELLWVASMPCVVDGDESVPIAEFGASNEGRFKHVYRRGLGYRYGKTMQVISGVHVNFSLPDEFWPQYAERFADPAAPRRSSDAAYFGLVRNAQRYGWLPLYLFGASPAVCRSFMKGRPQGALQDYDRTTLYLPFATSLRMSDIGYTNKKRCGLKVGLDSLDSYLAGLRWAVSTLCLPYSSIGVKKGQEYRQLNANVLQIANEYYSGMRPKQPPRRDESPLDALSARGVRYVELRTSDLQPFEPNGVGQGQLRFLEAWLIYCLLADSPAFDAGGQARAERNQLAVAARGRDPALRLEGDDGDDTPLPDWGLAICERMTGICEALDRGYGGRPYSAALAAARDALREPALTPSARVLATMAEEKQGFFHTVQALSRRHAAYFRERPLETQQQQAFVELTGRSLERQREMEAADAGADALSFDDYLARYNASVTAAAAG